MAGSSRIGGRYTLIRPLGEGATKEVFLATDEVLQREVALCVFKAHVTSPHYLARIRREARTLAGLSHSNIVQLYDLAEDDGCYLVTEYVPGGSLKAKIATDWKEQANLDDTLRIATDVADALAETHSKGIFHRDIKPNNVMLASDGSAKLGDFGLAKPLGDDSLSEEGLIVGTIPYMSPEQAKGLPADSPSDMYSFGVLLFELVTGRRPFHGEDASVLVHHLNSPPPPPTRYVPSCPPRLEALILRLLDKAPEARPTARETAAQLRRVRGEQTNGSRDINSRESTSVAGGLDPCPASAQPSGMGALLAPARRRNWFFPLAVPALALVLGFIAWRQLSIPALPAVSIDRVCEVDRHLGYDIEPGAAQADELHALYRLSADNRPIFHHLDRLREEYQNGIGHKGITYVYGAHGIGKSFLRRNYLEKLLPDKDVCVVKLRDVFDKGSQEHGISVAQKPDVVSINARVSLGTLPAISDSQKLHIERFLSAAGCARDDVLLPLVILDDIDEIHPDSAREILGSLDELILDSRELQAGFRQLIVLGAAEGFVPWFQDPKRHGGIANFFNVFKLAGPVFSNAGDLKVQAANLFRFQMGFDAWQRALRNGTAASLIEQYVRYVRRHRFLSYSIRSLSIATFISWRSNTNADDTEFELKEFVLNQLLKRSEDNHGRPGPLDDSYRRVLEAIASRYATRLDEHGFFVVDLDDTVTLTTAQGVSGEVRIREVLNRSGITTTVAESQSTTSYRFEPVWVQAHLIELANQRSSPDHHYRTCSES